MIIILVNLPWVAAQKFVVVSRDHDDCTDPVTLFCIDLAPVATYISNKPVTSLARFGCISSRV